MSASLHVLCTQRGGKAEPLADPACPTHILYADTDILILPQRIDRCDTRSTPCWQSGTDQQDDKGKQNGNQHTLPGNDKPQLHHGFKHPLNQRLDAKKGDTDPCIAA